MIKNIIFDLDSTLTDSLYTIAESRIWLFKEIIKMTGIDQDRILKELKIQLRSSIHDYKILERIKCLNEWTEKKDKVLRSKLIRKLEDQFFEKIKENTSFIGEAESVLRFLGKAGINLILISNKRARFVENTIENLDANSMFSEIYAREHEQAEIKSRIIKTFTASNRKPSPILRKRVIFENNLKESETIMVGNNLKNDGGLTLDSQIRFVHFTANHPSAVTKKNIFFLTDSEKLAFGVGGAMSPEYEEYKERVLVYKNIKHLKTLISVVKHENSL